MRSQHFHIDLAPLVSLNIHVQDSRGNLFSPPQPNWNFLWHLPANDQRSFTSFRADDAGPESKSASWQVPAGASLEVAPIFAASEIGEIQPTRHSLVVDASKVSVDIYFRFQDVEVGCLRILSRDGRPIRAPQVRFQTPINYDPVLVPDESGSSVVRIMLSKVRRTFVISAADHCPTTVDSAAIPTDGTALDVYLDAGQPILIVRVDFSGWHRKDLENPVSVRVVWNTTSDGKTFQWRYTYDLPPSGELVVLGQPPRVPHVEVASRDFLFKLISSTNEGGIPLREFTATPISGVLVSLVDSENTSWDRTKGVTLVAARALPPTDGKGTDSFTPGDGLTVHVAAADTAMLRLGSGSWLIYASQGAVSATEHVTIGVELVVLEVRPQHATETWSTLTIVDLTGECALEGTAVIFGLASLTAMQSAAQSAAAMTRAMLEGNSGLPRPRGKVASQGPCSAVAAYANGLVVVPAWFGERVVVMPAASLAVYEGVIDWNSARLTVRRPSWGGTVMFEPDSDLPSSLKEQGWFIAIRELRNLTDLTTMNGMDCKVPAIAGLATVQTLAPGSYVARYVRAGVVEGKNEATGHTKQEIRLEWFDGVQFDVQPGTLKVALPVTRS